MHGEDAFLCSICYTPVELENCKIDENGRAVHSDCYDKRVQHRPFLVEPLSTKKSRHIEEWRDLGDDNEPSLGWRRLSLHGQELVRSDIRESGRRRK